MAADGAIGEVTAALASPRWTVVQDGVERAGELLRAGVASGDEVAQIGSRMVELAVHPKWEVRKAVAGTIQHLKHETFHAAIARLLQDDNAYVQDAAQRTLARRSELTHADILKEQHGDLLLGWLSDLEGRHGPRARRDALKVAEKYTELMIREARHEIVKVIAPIDAALLNLENGLERAKVDREIYQKPLARARARVRFLTAIIDSLRDVTAEVTPDFHVEDLREMVEEALGLVKDRMRDKGGPMQTEVTVQPDVRVEAHRHRLLQAFCNVIQNAFEAYDSLAIPGKLTISSRPDSERHVVVSFTDDGCGMSEEALRDAFQLYSSGKSYGTGFGLPLAKKIIETEHGGSIRLASTKGKGTTVTVVLPLEQEDRQE